MKASCFLAAGWAAATWTAAAATSIDPVNFGAWGANIGWLNGRGDVANGAVIGEYVCSGYIYAANVGWINLGSGSPTNGMYYQNLSANDFGVNLDNLGYLRGYAWGANIGWINFEANGAPHVDLTTGNFSGYAYAANCGWISLSNALAYVQTDTLAPGPDSDGDGIPDAWELSWFGNLMTANGTSDFDGDGMSDKAEYLAGTSPVDREDNLRITHIERGVPPHSPTHVILEWTSKPTRLYRLEQRTAFDPASPWEQNITGFENLPGWSYVGFDEVGLQYFYRIRAVRPLMPGAPLLFILRTTTNTVAIAWPSPSTEWNLQQNTNTIGSLNWSNVTSGIQDDGTTKTLIVNPPAGNRFYRLNKP